MADAVVLRSQEQAKKGYQAENEKNYLSALTYFAYAKAILCDYINEQKLKKGSVEYSKLYNHIEQYEIFINKMKLAVMDTSGEEDEDSAPCKIQNLSFDKDSESCKFWFSTVVGMEQEKREVENSFVNPLLYPKLYGNISKGLLIYGPPGTGKCLAPDERVVMYDGTLVKSKELLPGDRLMGDDSTPRTVLSICSGYEEMYRITPQDVSGEAFEVNKPHILTLIGPYPKLTINAKKNNCKVLWYENGEKNVRLYNLSNENVREAKYFARGLCRDVHDISLEEYLEKPEKWKNLYKGFRTSAIWPLKSVYVEPYILGVWLGATDYQVYHVVLNQGLRRYNLTEENKFIPNVYKANCYETRQRLLAGIFDSLAEFQDNDTCTISHSSPKFLEDILFVARSLGIDCQMDNGLISLFAHDLYKIKTWNSTQTYLSEFYFTVERLGVDRYCGFTLSGNSRFLLKDFTVTHNTLLVKAAVNELSQRDPTVNVLFFAPTGADMKGKYFGESEKNIKSLFRCASKRACECDQNSDKQSISIIFMDEVESVARDRSQDESGLAATTVNALLQSMDGIESSENVSVIAVTNYPWQLDGAFLRRFDNRIFVDLPNEENIYLLLNLSLSLHVKNIMKDVSNKLVKFCSNLLGGQTKTAKAGCFNQCIMPDGSQTFAWRTSPLKNFITGISDAQMKAIATLLNKDNYSNSDISKVFKKAAQIAADKAVKENVFVKEITGQVELYISTLAYDSEVFQKVREERPHDIFYLIPPTKESIIIGNREFLIKELYPLLPVADESIENVYFLKTDNNNPKKVSVLLEFNIGLKQNSKLSPAELAEQNIRLEVLEKFLKTKKMTMDQFALLSPGEIMETVKDLKYQNENGNTFLAKLKHPSLIRYLKVYIESEVDYNVSTWDSLANAPYNYTIGIFFGKVDVQKNKIETTSNLGTLMKNAHTIYQPERKTTLGAWEVNPLASYDVSRPGEYLDDFIAFFSSSFIDITKQGVFDPTLNIYGLLSEKVTANVVYTNPKISSVKYSIVQNYMVLKNLMSKGKTPLIQKYLENNPDRIDTLNNLIGQVLKKENIDELYMQFINDISGEADKTAVMKEGRELHQEILNIENKKNINKIATNPNISYDILKQATTEIKSSIDKKLLEELRKYNKDPTTYVPPKN